VDEVNEVQSFVPSHMKHIFALDIKTDDSLKVKRRTLVTTSCEANSNSKEKIKVDGQASSRSITVQEADNLKAETGMVEALEISENIEDL